MLANWLYGSRKYQWILCISICFSVVLFCGMLSYLRHHQQAASVSERKLADLNEQIMQAEHQLDLMRVSWLDYQALLELGFVGNERRLNWLENLQGLSETLAIPQVKYRIEKRHRVEVDQLFSQILTDPDTGQPFSSDINFHVFRTAMHIEMTMLHEMDFMNLYQAIATQAQGLFLYDTCEVKRLLSSSLQSNEVVQNLVSHCWISWYSVEPSFSVTRVQEQAALWLSVAH